MHTAHRMAMLWSLKLDECYFYLFQWWDVGLPLLIWRVVIAILAVTVISIAVSSNDGMRCPQMCYFTIWSFIMLTLYFVVSAIIRYVPNIEYHFNQVFVLFRITLCTPPSPWCTWTFRKYFKGFEKYSWMSLLTRVDYFYRFASSQSAFLPTNWCD